MSVNSESYQKICKELVPFEATLVAVSKLKSIEDILLLYKLGHRDFGENYVQELTTKYNALPKDVQWHFIGHLQSNKAKFITPFVSLIHGVDSLKLLKEINKQGIKSNRIINCLLQIHIAQEETKFGFSFQEAEELLSADVQLELKNINIIGLMSMASLTADEKQIVQEFHSLKLFYNHVRSRHTNLKVLSLGMTGDYHLALREGSNMVRIGSAIFGERKVVSS